MSSETCRIGLQQAGLVDTVASVISSMDKDIQGMLWANIGLYGGLAQTEGLGERL
jgi:actin-related protein 6